MTLPNALISPGTGSYRSLTAGCGQPIGHFEDQKRAANAAFRAGDAAKLRAMIDLAGTQSSVVASPGAFDANPYLFGAANGVVDLKTGCFREARKEDYLTKQMGAEYVSGAGCPLWLQFLGDIFAHDLELIQFLQQAVGYSLTGSTKEQVFFFLYGTGRNGKSTFTETLQVVFGNYGQRAPAALFVADRHGREPEKEIARLTARV